MLVIILFTITDEEWLHFAPTGQQLVTKQRLQRF